MTLVEDRLHHSMVETVRKLDRANKRIYDMELVLEDIARTSIMDSISAIHMRALARATLKQVRSKL